MLTLMNDTKIFVIGPKKYIHVEIRKKYNFLPLAHTG